jgi:hypothetical protein
MRATCPAYLISLDLIFLIILQFTKPQYSVWISFFCHFYSTPNTNKWSYSEEDGAQEVWRLRNRLMNKISAVCVARKQDKNLRTVWKYGDSR